MFCPRFSPGQVPTDQAFPRDAPAHLRSREHRAQLPLPTVPPRQTGKADHFPAPAVIKSNRRTEALALGAESRALAKGKKLAGVPHLLVSHTSGWDAWGMQAALNTKH